MQSRSRVGTVILLTVMSFAARTAVAEPQKLYWTEEGSAGIKRSNLDGSQVEAVIATGENITYLTASQSLEKLFYAIGSPVPQLWSADFNGQNRQLLATLDTANYVRGLSFDAGTQKLYWTSSDGYTAGNGKVRSADANGSDVHDVLSLTDHYPYGMAIDSASGKMFWANTIQDTLEKADLNGASRQLIAAGVVSLTTQLAIDPVAQKLYWNDGDALKIRWSNYDGSQLAVINSLASAYTPYDSGIAVNHESGFLFWSDTSTDKIFRADLDGSNATAIISSGLSNPGSMVVVNVAEPSSGSLALLLLVVGAIARWSLHCRSVRPQSL